MPEPLTPPPGWLADLRPHLEANPNSYPTHRAMLALLDLAIEAANASGDIVEELATWYQEVLGPDEHQHYIDARTRFDGAMAEANEQPEGGGA